MRKVVTIICIVFMSSVIQRWGRQYGSIFLTNDTLKILKALNTGNASYKSDLFDRQFVKMMMKDLFGEIENWSPESKLDQSKIDFIKGTSVFTGHFVPEY